MKELTPDILQSRKHFRILDGLRGIAALSVVLFHFMEYVHPDYHTNFIGHGFLAVDFFFCLSGFVIAYAYDNRIEKMGVREFLKSRLIRLHPLIILGSVIGLLGLIFDPFNHDAGLYGFGKIFILFLASILLIPYPTIPENGLQLFNLNSPSWSLFFEYVANIFYGSVLYKITRRYLLLLAFLSAIAICFVSYRSGLLMGGWSGNNFWDGFARISYSFLAGMIVYRSNWIIKTNLGFISLSVLLFLAFILPFPEWNWIIDSLLVIFYFPLIVAIGAGATLKPALEKICFFMGVISYPLYMTHYAAINWFGHYYLSHKVSDTQLFFIIVAGTLLLLGLAYLAMKFYDTPLRRYLTERRAKK
jgi:peptidoglycan/LPS O-acetylase OafA/YrhL